MKRILTKICLFAAVALTVVSCLKDKDVTTYPQCAILSFSIGNITTRFYTKTHDGLSDSTYTRVIDGSTVGFNIDQLKGEIESVDSIIGWADISRVVPQITYSGQLFCKQHGWDAYYSFASGTDSVDFTHDVEFLVVSTDQQNSRIYKARLNKASLVSDSLYWTDMSDTHLSLSGLHRSIALGTRIYTFAAGDGSPTVTTLDTSDPTAWTPATALTGAASDLDILSITLFQDKFYALGADGHLYTASPETQGAEWTLADGGKTFSRLLCADKTYLYAHDGTCIVQSADLLTWTPNGTADLDQLPAAPVQSAAYNTQTHGGLQHVVMLGLNGTAEKKTSTWYKISSADNDIDQPWDHIPTPATTYVLPALDNLTMVRLGNTLLAFGGADANTGNTEKAFKTLYESADNGLTWHPYTSKKCLPEQLNEAPAQPVTAVSVGDQMWLIQSGGKVWRGIIGRQKP